MKGLSILAAFLGGAVELCSSRYFICSEPEKTLVAKLLMLYVKEVSN